jgi:16S rRNA (cytidine1402-2'-O)-methyltransferase
MSPGTLYLIPVNLAEPFQPDAILPRDVLDTTRQLDHFIAENAKTARAFLKAIGVNRPLQEISIVALDKHDSRGARAELLTPLLEGNDVGLVSEAGAPGIADPGAEVVALAHAKRIRVSPLVGPSSLLLGLMASGLNGQRFAFNGYLPVEKGERTKAITELQQESARRGMTQMFIETPYRNQTLLDELVKSLANTTKLAVAIDLTGAGQTVVSRTVADWKIAPVEIARSPALFMFLA